MPSKHKMDVFISYSSKDKAWVRGELLTRIEQDGLDAFKELLAKVFESPGPVVESLEVSKYAFVLMTKLFVLTDEGTKKVVLVVLRGDRGSSPLGGA